MCMVPTIENATRDMSGRRRCQERAAVVDTTTRKSALKDLNSKQLKTHRPAPARQRLIHVSSEHVNLRASRRVKMALVMMERASQILNRLSRSFRGCARAGGDPGQISNRRGENSRVFRLSASLASHRTSPEGLNVNKKTLLVSLSRQLGDEQYRKCCVCTCFRTGCLVG